MTYRHLALGQGVSPSLLVSTARSSIVLGPEFVEGVYREVCTEG